MDKRLAYYTRRNLKGGLFRDSLGFFSATTWLIIINVLIFIIFSVISFYNKNFIDYIALKPADLFAGKNLWTIITSMFMHAGITHLFFNMFSLFFIGTFVEKLIGKKRFISAYLLFGIFAGIFFAGISVLFGSSELGMKIFGDPNIAGLGASGAIFGLLGILAILTPKAKVYLIAGPLIAIIAEAILQNTLMQTSMLNFLDILVNLYLIISLFAIFSFNNRILKLAIPMQLPFWLVPIFAILPLVIIGLFVPLPIGNTAHFGGFIAGAVYGLYLRMKYPKKIQFLNRMVR